MQFAAMLADEYFLSFISLSAHIQPTEFYQLLLLSSSLVTLFGCGSGLDVIKFQHSSKLWPLCVIEQNCPPTDKTLANNLNKL